MNRLSFHNSCLFVVCIENESTKYMYIFNQDTNSSICCTSCLSFFERIFANTCYVEKSNKKFSQTERKTEGQKDGRIDWTKTLGLHIWYSTAQKKQKLENNKFLNILTSTEILFYFESRKSFSLLDQSPKMGYIFIT